MVPGLETTKPRQVSSVKADSRFLRQDALSDFPFVPKLPDQLHESLRSLHCRLTHSTGLFPPGQQHINSLISTLKPQKQEFLNEP